MPIPKPVSVDENPKSRLLGGFAPLDLKVIVTAARQRHFVSNSVVVSQGNPAEHLFLLTKGRARFFFNTPEGNKVILLWLTPGEILSQLASSNSATSAIAARGNVTSVTIGRGLTVGEELRRFRAGATAWTLRDIAASGCSTRGTK